jgi:peptide/nickel transport system substrate-binding protein
MTYLPRSIAYAAVFVALTAGASTSLGQDGTTTLKARMHSDLKVLDPIATTAYISRNHGYMIYDTLFAMDENLEPQPQMVGDYAVSDNGLTYTFTLRDGLKFHDGKPVTTADVIASLERWGERDGMGQALMAATKSLEAVDDKTFKLILAEPYGLVLESLGKMSSNVPFIMPKEVAETPSEQFIESTIGSGPFKFVTEEWRPGAVVVYEKFEDYIPREEPPSGLSGGKVAKVDRVEWVWIPDPNTTMNALMTGEIHYWENPPVELLPIVEQTPGVKVENLDPLGNQGMLRMNHLHPPLDNQKIRRAVAYAIDQEKYPAAAIGNPEYSQTCKSFYPCGSQMATDLGAEGLMEGNIERAKELMAEGGYDGTPVVIMQPTDNPVLKPLADVTAQALREAGFKVDLQAMDWQTLVSRRSQKIPPSEGGWNLFHTQWIGADVLNPIVTVGFIAEGVDGGSWFGWPEDQKMTELLTAFARSSEPEEQQRLAAEVQKRAYEIVTHLPLGQWLEPTAYRENVTGVLKAPVEVFWNVALQEG